MELDERTCLQNNYRLVHIQREPKTLQQLKEQAVKYISSVPFKEKFVIIRFEELLTTIISRKQARKAEDFLDVQKGFRGLEKYGLKLLQFPWRKEFHNVKLYSSYFKHNVETSVPLIVASPLLKLYGYNETSPEILQLQRTERSPPTLETAFELFLSTIELGVLYRIAKEVEPYTDQVTLEDVIRSRVKTVGDVKEARNYLFKIHGISNIPKRIRLDNQLDEQKQSKAYNIGTGKDSKATYAPTDTRAQSDQSFYSKAYSSGKARVEHISSTNGSVDVISDMELYGVDPTIPTPTYTNHYPQAMEIDDNDLYETMNGGISYQDYQSMHKLPEPLQPQQLPPPSYYEAVDPHFPGNMGDWVVVHETRNDPKTSYDLIPGMSKTSKYDPPIPHDLPGISQTGNQYANSFDFPRTKINKHDPTTPYDLPRISGLQINDNAPTKSSNGLKQGETIYSGRLEDEKISSNLKAFKQERMVEQRGCETNEPSEWMYIETAKGIVGPSNVIPFTSSQFKEPLRAIVTSTSTRKKSNPEKNNQFMEGFEMRQAQTRIQAEPVMSSKEMDANSEKYLTSSTSDQKKYFSLSTRVESSSSLPEKEPSKDQTSAKDFLPSSAIKTEIPETSSRTTKADLLPDQKQTSLANDSKENNQDNGYGNCLICQNEGTYMCGLCRQVTCEQCKGFLDSASCDTSPSAVPSIHQAISLKAEKVKQPTKDQENCSYCGKPSTHKCQICNRKSCNVCYLLKSDNCTSAMGHVFTSSTVNEVSVNYTDLQKELSESNVCDFCRLVAIFICADCHCRICKGCKKIYVKDLCSKTKKAHYFHLISTQTKIDPKEKPWSCGRCTYSNPPQNSICAICATSRGVTEIEYAKSGSRKCNHCTYGNPEGARVCRMCYQSIDKNTAESYI